MAPDGAKRKRRGGKQERIKTKTNERNSPAVLVADHELLLAEAGTAAGLLFASDADLFSEALLSTGRKMGLRLERGLTFPSGELGERDLDLFVGGGLGGGLGLPVR